MNSPCCNTHLVCSSCGKIHEEVLSPDEAEFRKFLDWVNKANVFGQEKKIFTPAALKNWTARRKSYEAKEIALAFANLHNEPDRWQLRNNGFRPLSWWLEKDDRIESMKNCHKKGVGVSIIL